MGYQGAFGTAQMVIYGYICLCMMADCAILSFI